MNRIVIEGWGKSECMLLGVINLGLLCHRNEVTRGVISGFRCEVGGNCEIVGYYYATSGGNSLQSVKHYHHLLGNNNTE